MNNNRTADPINVNIKERAKKHLERSYGVDGAVNINNTLYTIMRVIVQEMEDCNHPYKIAEDGGSIRYCKLLSNINGMKYFCPTEDILYNIKCKFGDVDTNTEYYIDSRTGDFCMVYCDTIELYEKYRNSANHIRLVFEDLELIVSSDGCIAAVIIDDVSFYSNSDSMCIARCDEYIEFKEKGIVGLRIIN